jgi:hypothetical protein
VFLRCVNDFEITRKIHNFINAVERSHLFKHHIHILDISYEFIFGLSVNVLENIKERDHLRDLGVDGRILLKWITKK